MDSEANSSTFASSTSQTLSQKVSKRKGAPPSKVWLHCRVARGGEKPTYKYCNYCIEDPIYGSDNSSNMRKHLQGRHEVNVEVAISRVQEAAFQQLKELYLRAGSSGQTSEIDIQVLRKHLDRDVINEALISMIVVQNLPFAMVEWPEFHVLCQVLNPESKEFVTTTQSQVKNKIDQAFEIHKDTVRKKLQSALTNIHLSVNIWTSTNNHLYLGVIGDFIDCVEEKHQNALLGLRPVAGHSGEAHFSVLLPILQEYGIVQKLGAVIGDNSSTNDTLCRAIEAHFLKEEDLQWSATRWRIRCMGHIINLTVQGFLFYNLISMEELELYDELEKKGELEDIDKFKQKFRLLGPLGKLHNIVVDIRSSASRTTEFLTLSPRMVPLDDRTRWNSWHDSLVVANKLAAAVDTYTKAHWADLSGDFITPTDWKKLRTIEEFLQLFHTATLKLEGHRATPENVLFIMDIIAKYFEESLVKFHSNKDFASRVKKGWEVFNKYHSRTDATPLYTAALILHPSRRTQHIKAHWPTKWAKPNLKKVEQLWESYREKTYVPSLSTSYDKVPHKPEEELDAFDRIAQDLEKYLRPGSEDEYQDYINQAPYDIGKMTALMWWSQESQRERWPRLSLMALDILSIPAMSDEAERVFSGARRTITWERAQMEPPTIEKVECLKYWKQSGIIDQIVT